MTLFEFAAQLSRAEARRLLEAPPLIEREREIFGEVGREETNERDDLETSEMGDAS